MHPILKRLMSAPGREEPLISEFLTTALEKSLPTDGGEPKIYIESPQKV